MLAHYIHRQVLSHISKRFTYYSHENCFYVHCTEANAYMYEYRNFARHLLEQNCEQFL